MRREFIKFFYNVRMNDKVGLLEQPKVYINYGNYDFDNYIMFDLGKFKCKISCEKGILIFNDIQQVKIHVESIEVYKDGWIHNIPRRMKTELKEEMKKIKTFNNLCRKNKLDKHYTKYEKNLNKESKRKKEEKFLKEQTELKEIFKS